MTSLARDVPPLLLTATLTAILAGTLAASACNRQAAAPDVSKFLGTWTVDTGALTVSCSNGQTPSIPVTEPTVLARGTTSHLLDTDPVCPVNYNVSGNVATALPGQICKNPKVVTDMHIVADTFTIADGGTATHNASGRLSGFIDVSMAAPVKCTFTEIATYRRSNP